MNSKQVIEKNQKACLLIYFSKEQNRQYALMIENQKQQRARLEDQRQFGVGSSMVIIFSNKNSNYCLDFLFVQSGRSSQTQPDGDLVRQIEQKYRRDLEHLQEQLEVKFFCSSFYTTRCFLRFTFKPLVFQQLKKRTYQLD